MNTKRRIKGFWENQENQRNFLLELQKKFNISKPEEWGKITWRDVVKTGGIALLLKHGSLLNALQQNFSGNLLIKYSISDTKWDKSWFVNIPKNNSGFWTEKSNQLLFMEQLKTKLGIKEPIDWGKVTLKTIYDNGGRTLIKLHGGSLLKTLQVLYPSEEWNKEWFQNISDKPHGYWNNPQNEREYMLAVAKELNIRQPKDWGKVTVRDIYERGGRYLLLKYEDISWNALWFHNIPKYSSKYWDKEENCRRFFDELARDYNIKEVGDWQKVSVNLIYQRGGRGLLQKYGHSLFLALKSIYPNQDWLSIAPLITSEPQKGMNGVVENFFPK